MIDMIILGFLSLKELTAYDIKKAMDNTINHFYSTSYGSIHPALVKMEKNLLIHSKEYKEGGRSKKLYTINDLGREVFNQWLSENIVVTRLKEDALVKVFFFGMLDKESRKKVMTNYLLQIDEWSKQLNKIKKNFNQEEIPEAFREIARFQLETLRFGMDQAEFSKEWFNDFSTNRI